VCSSDLILLVADNHTIVPILLTTANISPTSSYSLPLKDSYDYLVKGLPILVTLMRKVELSSIVDKKVNFIIRHLSLAI